MAIRRLPALARWRLLVAALLFRVPVVQRVWSRRYPAVRASDIPWTPLRKPLSRCRLALVTTGGVHLASDLPFDMSDPQGDASFRVIPSAVDPSDLKITHDYYDHRDAERDINVVFPIGILRRFQAEGRIGPSASQFYSLMGHIEGPHLHQLIHSTAPALAARMKEDAVDIALFVPA